MPNEHVTKAVADVTSVFSEAEKIVDVMKPGDTISLYDCMRKVWHNGTYRRDFFDLHGMLRFYLLGHPSLFSLTHSGTGDYRKLSKEEEDA
jgi:hypothetical protein